MVETEKGDWKDGEYEIYVVDNRPATMFFVPRIQEAEAKRIVESLNSAMEKQRHEFLWGLANMHREGTLYGDDDE
jgi:long-subunit acyl-CoA synthetase (AMP-forming)